MDRAFGKGCLIDGKRQKKSKHSGGQACEVPLAGHVVLFPEKKGFGQESTVETQAGTEKTENELLAGDWIKIRQRPGAGNAF